MTRHRFDKSCKRLVSMAISACIAATLLPWPAQPAHAADSIQTVATSYQPTVSETVDASGFKHPGIGFTKDILENMRTQVRAQREPWTTYFNAMLAMDVASKTPAIKNVSGADPAQPRYYGLSSQGIQASFIQDANTAYTQAILYFVTGDDTYRANAMRIIRLYGKMDPAQYVYYTDAHIHTGIPLSRMVGAAEILRYTSTQTPALEWTADDTAKFSANLVVPVVQTFNSCNCRFMNQHLYTTIAAMTGSIFTENRGKYNEAVEWFTVNKDALDQGQNGAIKQLFRLVTRNDLTGEPVPPVVQHVEMGRDQAHGAGDITNAQILSRLMMAQGTKVDPVEGTVSSAADAVGPYEFLNDRILDASEQFAKYMIGYELPWVPTASHTDEAGNPTILYKRVSGSYRGRSGQNTWELYYYYKYVRGVDMAQRAPNFTQFFAKRSAYNWSGADGGGDFWMFIPAAATAEGASLLVKPIIDPQREVEERYTALDGNSAAMQDGATSFVRVTATAEGSKITVFGYGYGAPNYGVRIRTNGAASMTLYDTNYPLPDTHGQWRYVILPGNVNDFLPLTFVGGGTTIDVDHINVKASTLLTPPVFAAGGADATLYSYAGATLATTMDLSATDPGAGEVVTYQAENLPAGASFNTATGAFSWQPTQAGTYTFFVGASDGTTVTMKRVTIVIDADRQAAVNRATARYQPGTAYVASTLPAYNAAYADMMAAIGGAGDAVFFQKLAALRIAAEGLQELNPLLGDGSLDFRTMFFTSDFGSAVPNLVDNNQDSAVGYSTALVYKMDFGAGFKVAANGFAVRTVEGFPERIGGVAIFGSNDNENWTRLTPGLTSRLDEMQAVAVQDDLKDVKYRFLQMRMIEPFTPVYQPVPLLQLSELRIYGVRYATVNKVASVNLSSAQALRNRVIAGDTVKLSFVSTEEINNVTATIGGVQASVATTDNLNWTATAVLSGTTPAGPVKFLLNYKTAEGVDGEPTFMTTDATALSVASQANYIGNLPAITTPSDSGNQSAANLLAAVNALQDKNLATVTDFRVAGSGSGSWVAFDFRGGGTVALNRVEVIGPQGKYYARINGTVVQGSNDYSNWTTISNAAYATEDWQTLTITDPTPYRYIRLFNGNAWYGNMSELRLYGVVESTNMIASTSISSAQALRTRVVPGDTVKLAFTAKEAINGVSATILGAAATVATTDNINFAATAVLPQGAAAGKVAFAVNYRTGAGKDGYPATATSDGTSLNLVDEADTIKNIGTIATLIDSTANRSAAGTLQIVNTLFDGNLGTGSDFRNGSSSGAGAYITFDFKAGNQASLTSVELAPRQDQYYTRIKGAVVQGSNDNVAWTNLTAAAASTMEWQTLATASQAPYRYVRIYNPNAWFGSMTEVRLHGSVGAGATVT
ncbi:MAG: discoidin domain-containing protein, partial [Duganella sp.]